MLHNSGLLSNFAYNMSQTMTIDNKKTNLLLNNRDGKN
jgi:hypothetical protein